MIAVTLYGREGCRLCEEARAQVLDVIAARPAIQLVEVDIESSEQLHRELLERIPVVEVEGERIAELFLDADALRRRLDTLSS